MHEVIVSTYVNKHSATSKIIKESLDKLPRYNNQRDLKTEKICNLVYIVPFWF